MTTRPNDQNMPGEPQPGQPHPYSGGDTQHGSPQYGGQQAYPAGANQIGGAGRPGELLPRFSARLLDTVIVVVPLVIISAIFAAFGGTVGVGSANSDDFRFGTWIGGVIISLIYAAAMIGYFVWMESSRGQTFGKQVCNLRTEGPNGGNPTMDQALKRNAYLVISAGGGLIASILSIGSVLGVIGAVVSLICGLAALTLVIVMAVTISSSPTKQGKHDEFAGGTRVVTTSQHSSRR